MLGKLGHTGIDVENLEPDEKRKIKRALRMFDQAEKVYQELFCKDEEAIKLEVIKLYNWKIYFCCIVMVLSTHGLRLGRSY